MTGDIFLTNIWRNKYIKKIILNHLSIEKLVYYHSVGSEKPFHFDIDTLSRYKYRNYLTDIVFGPPHFIQSLDSKHFYHKKECYRYNNEDDDNEDDGDESYFYFSIKEDDNEDINNNNDEDQFTNSIEKKRKLENYNDQVRLLCTCFKSVTYESSLLFKQKGLYKISAGIIPCFCENLYLEIDNKQLEIGIIPDNVIELVINCNIKILPGSIPPSVQYLKFENLFNLQLNSVDCCLPDTLKYLSFGFNYNQKINNGALPKNLKSITFSHSFQQEISNDNIPPFIENIQFSRNYDKDNLKLDNSNNKINIKIG